MNEQKYIRVRVTVRAKKEFVMKVGEVYHISVKEKATQGRANKRVRELLSETLVCSPTQLRMVKGATQPAKTFLFITK